MIVCFVYLDITPLHSTHAVRRTLVIVYDKLDFKCQARWSANGEQRKPLAHRAPCTREAPGCPALLQAAGRGWLSVLQTSGHPVMPHWALA